MRAMVLAVLACLSCGPRPPLDGTWVFELPRPVHQETYSEADGGYSFSQFPPALETHTVVIETGGGIARMTIEPCTFAGAVVDPAQASFDGGEPCDVTESSILFGEKRPDFPRRFGSLQAIFRVDGGQARLDLSGIAWPSEALWFDGALGRRENSN